MLCIWVQLLIPRLSQRPCHMYRSGTLTLCISPPPICYFLLQPHLAPLQRSLKGRLLSFPETLSSLVSGGLFPHSLPGLYVWPPLGQAPNLTAYTSPTTKSGSCCLTPPMHTCTGICSLWDTCQQGPDWQALEGGEPGLESFLCLRKDSNKCAPAAWVPPAGGT